MVKVWTEKNFNCCTYNRWTQFKKNVHIRAYMEILTIC